MQPFLLLSPLGITYNPLNLLLHPLHGIGTAASRLGRQTQPNTPSGPKLQYALILRSQPHPRPLNSTIDLSIKVVCIRILRDELGHLDPGNEILVGLSHQVVIPRLQHVRYQRKFSDTRIRCLPCERFLQPFAGAFPPSSQPRQFCAWPLF